MILRISVDKLTINAKTNRLIISDSAFFVEAHFEFDSDWDYLSKTATFYAGDDSYDMLLTNDACEVPHEIIADGTEFRITVSGYGDKIIRTKAMLSPITVYSAGRFQGSTPGAYTPELWEQVLQNLNTKQNTLVAGRNITLDPQQDGTVRISAEGVASVYTIEAVYEDGSITCDDSIADIIELLNEGKQVKLSLSGERPNYDTTVYSLNDYGYTENGNKYIRFTRELDRQIIVVLGQIVFGNDMWSYKVEPFETEKFDVIFTFTGNNIAASKRVYEIGQAFADGKEVRAFENEPYYGYNFSYFTLESVVNEMTGYYSVSFVGRRVSDEKMFRIRGEHGNTDTWTAEEISDLADYQTKIITDTGGYYDTDTVEGVLQEIGEKIASFPTEVWNGGSY